MNAEKLVAAALLLFIVSAPAGRAKPPCPASIVSLSLASDEILVDTVGDKRRIAALTYFASDPAISNVAEKAKGIPSVRANLEQVIGKSPDLVILAHHTNPNIRAHLRKAGVETLVLGEVVSLRSIKRNIRMVGKAVCESRAAEKLVEGMDGRIADARKKIPPDKPAPAVLFYGAPGFTVGAGTTINDIIESSGGINAALRAGISGHVNISTEHIVQTDPDMVLTSSYNPSHPDFAGGLLRNPALRERRIVVLPAKHLDAASHYAALGVSDLVDSILETPTNETDADH